MLLPVVLKSWLQRATFGSVLIALISIATPASSQSTGIDPDHPKTATPIKHVIVLIGENRTFDHVFATYVPRGRDSVPIMGDSAQRAAHIKDATDFFAAVDNGDLPSVSYVKPDGLIDGHPASSKLDLFEGMVENIYDHLKANPDLMETTAFIITFDEGGGYYDSGYIQPVDFFGDGPRIPLIVVSLFSEGGHISHTYADHVSILKFIERNWHLKPLTNRSRDNFPNPMATHDNPYVPLNSPALGDLFDLFHFDQHDDH